MSDNEWTVATLKEHIDDMLTERDKGVTAVIAEREKAVRLAVVEVERRLDVLNHAHENMVHDREQFFTKGEHVQYAKAIDERIGQIAKVQIQVLEDKKNYISRPEHIGTIKTLDDKIAAVGKTIDEKFENLSKIQISQADDKKMFVTRTELFTGVGVVMTIVSVFGYIAFNTITAYKEQAYSLQQAVASHEHSTTSEIDQLRELLAPRPAAKSK